MSAGIDLEAFLNSFAIHCFRNIADGDYISARMCYRSRLVVQYLWASQQAIEKYLKCILLLARIPAPNIKHDLGRALGEIAASGAISLDLTSPTKEFIEYIDTYGAWRYLEISHFAVGRDIVRLDRTVWELRRFCTCDESARNAKLRDGHPAPKVRLVGGYLESIIDAQKTSAREQLLWQNAFFGRRTRRRVAVPDSYSVTNSPLALDPQYIDEVSRYVHVPKRVAEAYRQMTNEREKHVPQNTPIR